MSKHNTATAHDVTISPEGEVKIHFGASSE